MSPGDRKVTGLNTATNYKQPIISKIACVLAYLYKYYLVGRRIVYKYASDLNEASKWPC